MCNVTRYMQKTGGPQVILVLFTEIFDIHLLNLTVFDMIDNYNTNVLINSQDDAPIHDGYQISTFVRFNNEAFDCICCI